MTLVSTLSARKMPEMLRSMKKKLVPVAKEAYIFGSFAKGYAIPGESDVDLFIVPKKKLSLNNAYKILDKEFTSLIERKLVLHILIYEKGMKHLLEEARQGVKIV